MRTLSNPDVAEAGHAISQEPDWLGRLAHDLRGPIGPLQMVGRVLEGSTPDIPQMCELGRTIERQTNRLIGLADNLDDMMRIGLDVFQMHKMRCDLKAIVENAVVQAGLHAHRVGRGCRAIAIRGPAAPVLVEADERRLAQLVGLLISAIAPEGIEAECWIECQPERHLAVVRLRDSERRIYRSDGIAYLMTGQPPIDPGTLSMASLIGHHIALSHEARISAEAEPNGRIGELVMRMPLAGA